MRLIEYRSLSTRRGRGGSLPLLPTGPIPHAREHVFDEGEALGDAGPSRQARGAPGDRRDRGHLGGTIPARAGSTLTSFLPSRCAWDHPRTRGEHTGVPEGTMTRTGPSPHARGAPVARVLLRPLVGTIPARAGSALADLHSYRAIGFLSMTSTESDLSPKACFRDRLPSPVNTTRTRRQPPRARSTQESRPGGRDHPARAGALRDRHMIRTVEPSPQARGARAAVGDQQVRAGTIPTRAGSTTPSRPGCRTPGDHPHGRGGTWR